MITHNFFNDLFVIPILNVLVALYSALHALHIPGAFGFAIIALTVGIRFLLHPFFKQQIHTARKMQEIKPHLDRLTQEHKKDPKKLQQEQLKLYQEHGLNPASGCLFLIVQIPVFIGLYSTLNAFLHDGVSTKAVSSINSLLYSKSIAIQQAIDPNFFGLNLAITPQKAGAWFYLLIPVITGVLQYFQATVSMAQQAPEPKAVVKKKKGEPEKSDMSGDFQKAMNTQMKYIFPFMIGYFAYTLPIGLSLYWNIFSLFSILQYRKVNTK